MHPVSWPVVIRLGGLLTALSALGVLVGGTALWALEGQHPDSSLRSWGDGLWWSLTTLTTTGYGDVVPVTTAGRCVAAAVMIAGVAMIGAVAAIVALAVARRVATEEERAFAVEAETLERRLEVRLDRIEAQLTELTGHLPARPGGGAGGPTERRE